MSKELFFYRFKCEHKP